jgi:hypothetical protein
MKPQATLRRALSDRNLLGGVLAGDSWRAWRVLLIAAMGEPLTEDERTLFAELIVRRSRYSASRSLLASLAVVAASHAPLPCWPRT